MTRETRCILIIEFMSYVPESLTEENKTSDIGLNSYWFSWPERQWLLLCYVTLMALLRNVNKLEQRTAPMTTANPQGPSATSSRLHVEPFVSSRTDHSRVQREDPH